MTRPPDLRFFILAVALSACLAAPTRATRSYSYRNAPSDHIDLGVGRIADLWWANDFQVVPGGHTLTHIQVAFGPGLQTGTPVHILVYDDVNNDRLADDLTLLTRFDTAVQTVNTPAGPTLLDNFDIPDTPVDGTFFVAVLIPEAPATARLRAETTAPAGHSWLAVNLAGPGTFDPADPSAAEQGPLFVEAFTSSPGTPQADWIIEAIAIPEPATATLILILAGYLTLRGRARTISALVREREAPSK